MDYNRLGDTDLVVSKLALGTGSLGEMFGPLSESDAIAVVHEALDLGINLIDTAPYYASAERRLGKALAGRRAEVVLATKAGRYGVQDFDFSPRRIRTGLEHSLRLLGTDYVDILQLHDIEFTELGPVFEDGYAELLALRDAGKCRYVGMTGYPAATMARAMRETNLDVVLTYSHATLLDDTLPRVLAPIAAEQGVGLINAAAVSLGLLTAKGSVIESGHPATAEIRDAAARMSALCAQNGQDVSFVANQYSIQRSGCATTVVGTGKSRHLHSALAAIDAPIDEDLIEALLSLRPSIPSRTWTSGLAENNGEVDEVSAR